MLKFVGSALKALKDADEFRKHRDAISKIAPGQSFVRARTAAILETARVANIVTVGKGIPHVRYHVKVREQLGSFDDGVRTLGAARFLELYSRKAEPLAEKR